MPTPNTPPSLALRVSDLARSLAFYCDALGFTRTGEPATSDIATIVDVDGDAFVVAGPAAGDDGALAAHLGPDPWIMPASEMLRYADTDLAALRARLASHGVSDVREVRLPWGDPALDVSDPDGRVLRFVGQVRRTPDEQVALYARGMDDLDLALHELSDTDLDLAPGDGGWTIRQIVNHLVDGDTLIVLPHVKMALAESGRTRIANSFNQETWARALYAHVEVAESLALLRATRNYVRAMLRSQPEAWEQFAVVQSAGAEGRRVTIAEMIVTMSHHLFDHVEQIRQAHGR